MLRQFFHQSRAYFELDHRQAKAYLWLLFFTLLVLSSPLFTYYFYPTPYDISDIQVIEAFDDSLPFMAKYDQPKILFHKGIDRMQEQDWIKAGLPSFMAKRIIKYQSKIKPLQKVNDLYTIYGMDSARVEKLKPYLEDAITPSKASTKPIRYKKQQASFIVLDINSADSSALEALPAIGLVLSKRILKYRELLKGYVRKEQYAEIYGISPEALSVLKMQTEIKTIPVVCSLASADYLKLSAHFYLSGKDAKFIMGQVKINRQACWDELKSGLEEKAQQHVEELKLYYSCESR
ncbi:MAG: transporter [Chitinophagaceae bacterium]|nr:transporter [Chitinophagaceae bacterium]